MSNGTQRGVPMDNKCEVKEEFLRVEDALGALESQQDTILRQTNEITCRLTGKPIDEPVVNDVTSYEQRLQRLMLINDIIVDGLSRFIEKF